MQSASANLTTELQGGNSRPSDVVEVYAADYIPPSGGFEPANALKRFANTKLTWNSIVYEREKVSRGAVSRFMGEQFNNVSFEFSNVSRALATFILANNVEGMWCVVRRISRAVTDDSVILFVGRWDKASDIDKTSGSWSAKQAIGAIQYEMPPRRFVVDDPSGRLPSDPLYEGFRFTPVQGTFQYQVEEKKRFLFFFTKKKKKTVTAQWSSFSDTPLGEPIPIIAAGRCQMKGIPIEYGDTGTTVKFLMAFVDGLDYGVSAIENVKNQTRGFSDPTSVTKHLGELGGVGSQTADALFPNSGTFSRTAYVGGQVTGSTPESVDSAPEITATIFCKMPTRDAAGVYNTTRFTDNPIDAARYVITSARLLNHPAALIDDAANLIEAQYCDFPILDVSNAERVFLPNDAVTEAQAGAFRRFRSTGRLDLGTYRYQLGLDLVLPEIIEPEYEGFDPDTPPTSQAVVTFLRKRYTANCPVTDTMKAVDFLNKVLAPAARLYYLTSKVGKVQIKVERPADSVLLRSATSAGATVISVEDVDPWKTSLQGFVLVGVTRNEVQQVTITGSPTGGSFTLTFSGQTTSAIAWNATAEALQSALEALSNVALGDVLVQGNQGGPYTVNFRGSLGRQNLTQMTAASSLTGGTTPTVTVTTAVNGTDGTLSEVRKVSAARFSTAGNSITLTAGVTGGVTATASGATLTGATDAVTASGTVTIGGTPAAGNTVTVTIDGIPIVYTVATDDTTGTIAAQLRDHINANLTLRRYVKAEWAVGTPTVVTIKSKLGHLDLTAQLNNAHAISEEVIRVMKSFADKANVQANLTRANIRKGTFKWPHGNKEPHINQVKLNFRDARNDFAETPYELNDTADQNRLRKVLPREVDGSAIDNLHQARRVAQMEFSKHVDGNKFYSWAARNDDSILLEEGDVVCVTESSGGFVNLPVRIEEMRIPEKLGPSFTARIYSTQMFSDEVQKHEIPLPTSLATRILDEGSATVATAGGSTTLSATEANSGTVVATGTGGTIIVPDATRTRTFINNSSGTITVRTVDGSGATTTVAAGARAVINASGANAQTVGDPTTFTAPTWAAVSFQNSWVNFGGTIQTVQYSKDSFGWVRVRGAMKSGTMNTVAFNLPVGFRPAADEYFAVDSAGVYGKVEITSNGDVKATVGSNVVIWLSSIGFKAA